MAGASSAAESHPVALPFAVALVVRVVAAAGITAFQHGYLFPDESGYVGFGRLAASGQLTPATDSGYGEQLFHQAASFMWPVTVLFKMFGPHVIVVALWAGLFGALTAALVAALACRALSHGWSALAGLTVAVFPSQILWSSVVLRESMVWAGLAGSSGRDLDFRTGKTLAIACRRHALGRGQPPLARIPSLLGRSCRPRGQRPWRCGCSAPPVPVLTRTLCALLCLLVPLASGLGLAGNTYVRDHGQQLGYERSVLAEGAKSAFVHPKVVAAKGSAPTKAGRTPTTVSVTVPSAVANEDIVVPEWLRQRPQSATNWLRGLRFATVPLAAR